jgi:hypothetical protein
MKTLDKPPAPAKFASVAKSAGGFELFRLDIEDPASPGEDGLIDVVFVHGLSGDPMATWGISHKPAAVLAGWPVDLARELRQKARFWTAGYDAPLVAPRSDPQSLDQQGRDALTALAGAGIGRRKLIFVAHSLGGILVKAILTSAAQTLDDGEKRLLKNTHGVVFVGTPHSGSDLTLLRHAIPIVVKGAASGLGWAVGVLMGALATTAAISLSGFGHEWKPTLGWILAAVLIPLCSLVLYRLVRPSDHVLTLDVSNPALYDLTHHYRRVLAMRPFTTRAFYERQRVWLFFRPVPRGSADPGVTDCTPVGINANHISMCKGEKAVPIADAIRALISASRRGQDVPVFERYLDLANYEPAQRSKVKPLFRLEDESYVKSFSQVIGDRAKAESALREHLRHQFSHANPPSTVELDLAERSAFDIDAFVWCFWHERSIIRSQRKLRLKAEASMNRGILNSNRHARA